MLDRFRAETFQLLHTIQADSILLAGGNGHPQGKWESLEKLVRLRRPFPYGKVMSSSQNYTPNNFRNLYYFGTTSGKDRETAMAATDKSRIVIEDLPVLEHLSAAEAATIFGAGRTRLGLEQLETRNLMAAGLASSLVMDHYPPPTTQTNEQVATVHSAPSSHEQWFDTGCQFIEDEKKIGLRQTWKLPELPPEVDTILVRTPLVSAPGHSEPSNHDQRLYSDGYLGDEKPGWLERSQHFPQHAPDRFINMQVPNSPVSTPHHSALDAALASFVNPGNPQGNQLGIIPAVENRAGQPGDQIHSFHVAKHVGTAPEITGDPTKEKSQETRSETDHGSSEPRIISNDNNIFEIGLETPKE